MGTRDCLKLLSQAAGRKVSTAEQDEFFSRLNQSKEALKGQYPDDKALTIAAAQHAADALMKEATSQHASVRESITNQALVKGGHLYSPSDHVVRSEAEKLFQKKPGSDVGHKREAASGRYVGAPDWVGSSPQKLAAMRKNLQKLVVEGTVGRYWYEKSARAVMNLVGGNKNDAEKFVGLLAIYSQGTGVAMNTSAALKAWYAWKAGDPIDAGRFPTAMGKKAEAWLNRGEDWGGIKTNNFYTDLMEEIDPSKVDLHHSTMDMWMALAFDYGSNKLDQGPKYTFAQREIKNIADQIGWRPHQVQAAIWTAIKARVEGSEVARKEYERANGILRDVVDSEGKTTSEVVKGREYDHFRTATRFGMESKITQAEIDKSDYDFGTALGERTAQVSWEATPGASTGVLPGIHNAPMYQQIEYLTAIRKAISDAHGNDLIDKKLGLLISHGDQWYSGWEGKTSVGIQQKAGVTVNEGMVTGQSRLRVNLAADLRGMLLHQEAVAWHFPNFKSGLYGQNGAEFNIGRPLTEVETSNLYRSLSEHLKSTDSPPIPTENGFRVLHFPQEKFELLSEMEKPKAQQDKAKIKDLQKVLRQKNKEFHDLVERAVLDQQWHDTINSQDRFESDGDLRSNDWRNGDEDYRSRISEAQESLGQQNKDSGAGSPDLLKWLEDELRPRVEAVNDDFSARYGWGSTGRPATSKSVGGEASSTDQRAGRGITITGSHFSRQQRETLDGRYYGTGISGQESDRIAQSNDPRLRSRLYFYVDEGKGVFPESGVGGSEHKVSLDSLYDVRKDPDGIWKSKRDLPTPEERANARESALLDAGYKGYYVSEAFHRQGAAVLIGEGSHGVRPQRFNQLEQIKPKHIISPETMSEAQRLIAEHPVQNTEVKLEPEVRAEAEAKLAPVAKAAALNKPEFDRNLDRIAHAVGGYAMKADIKGLKRAAEKLVLENNGDVSTMKDLLRGTIVVPNMREAQKVIDKIASIYKFDRIKNRTSDPALHQGGELPGKPMSSGYQDFLTNVILPDGHIAEIQINTPEMLAAKKIGHKLYEIQRTLSEDDPLTDVLERTQQKVYGEALDANLRNSSLSTGEASANTSARGQGYPESAQNALPSGSTTMGASSFSKNLHPSGRADTSIGTGISNSPFGINSIQRNAVVAKGAYDPAARLISLYRHADATTVVHESAHEYFDIYAKIAVDPSSPLEIRQDVDTILHFLGVESLAKWHSMSFEEQRPYHEQLAQSYERYMMEAKAPSAMMNVFAKIRTWMLETYRAMTEAGVEPTPELRKVFDKWSGQDIVPDRLKAATEEAPVKLEPQVREAIPEHPLVTEAARIVDENPDLLVPMADAEGRTIYDENNKPKFESAKEVLDNAKADAELSMKNDPNVVSAIVQCVLGAM